MTSDHTTQELRQLLASKNHCSPELNRVGLAVLDDLEGRAADAQPTRVITLSQQYAVVHAALAAVAQEEAVTPFAMRIVLALYEHGPLGSDALERLLGVEPSFVRRNLGDLYATGHVIGTGPNGGLRKRGMRSQLTLGPGGVKAAVRMLGIMRANGVT